MSWEEQHQEEEAGPPLYDGAHYLHYHTTSSGAKGAASHQHDSSSGGGNGWEPLLRFVINYHQPRTVSYHARRVGRDSLPPPPTYRPAPPQPSWADGAWLPVVVCQVWGLVVVDGAAYDLTLRYGNLTRGTWTADLPLPPTTTPTAATHDDDEAGAVDDDDGSGGGRMHHAPRPVPGQPSSTGGAVGVPGGCYAYWFAFSAQDGRTTTNTTAAAPPPYRPGLTHQLAACLPACLAVPPSLSSLPRLCVGGAVVGLLPHGRRGQLLRHQQLPPTAQQTGTAAGRTARHPEPPPAAEPAPTSS